MFGAVYSILVINVSTVAATGGEDLVITQQTHTTAECINKRSYKRI